MPTHDVFNQPPPLENYNAFDEDRALGEALERHGGAWGAPRVREVGRLVGGEAMVWGAQANRHPPELHTHDRFGHRIDEVEFHPAWHNLMAAAVGSGLHSLPWQQSRQGAHVVRAAAGYLMGQAESGHGCPITMTFAAVPALRAQPDVAEEWVPRFISSEYDPRCIPAAQKKGALCGMAMTEKQGG
ncbi:MAG TPA: hypothetical protein VNO21_21530, partial [Polyangiaceae bacterium]|nr:hypothetical protein [Polyangiaceae bacterium]